MQSLRDGSRIVMKHDFIVTRIYIQYISCNAVPLYTQPQCGRNAVLLYTQPQCDRNAVLFYTLTQAKCGLLSKMNHHCNNNNVSFKYSTLLYVYVCMVEEHTLRQFLLATRHTASHTLLLNEMLHVSLLLFILTLWCCVAIVFTYCEHIFW